MSSLLVVPDRFDSDVTGASPRRAQPRYSGPLFAKEPSRKDYYSPIAGSRPDITNYIPVNLWATLTVEVRKSGYKCCEGYQ